jgi:hypothetical protein
MNARSVSQDPFLILISLARTHVLENEIYFAYASQQNKRVDKYVLACKSSLHVSWVCGALRVFVHCCLSPHCLAM